MAHMKRFVKLHRFSVSILHPFDLTFTATIVAPPDQARPLSSEIILAIFGVLRKGAYGNVVTCDDYTRGAKITDRREIWTRSCKINADIARLEFINSTSGNLLAEWPSKDSGKNSGNENVGASAQSENPQIAPPANNEPSIQFLDAAQRGDETAQFNLANSYAYGRGVSRDDVQALMWLNIAIPRVSTTEGGWRDLATRSRDGLAARMTPSQVAEAQRLAHEWTPK